MIDENVRRTGFGRLAIVFPRTEHGPSGRTVRSKTEFVAFAAVECGDLVLFKPLAIGVSLEYINSATVDAGHVAGPGANKRKIPRQNDTEAEVIETRPIVSRKLGGLQPFAVTGASENVGGAHDGHLAVIRMYRADDCRIPVHGDAVTEILKEMPIASAQLLCFGHRMRHCEANGADTESEGPQDACRTA